jgi:hypothetical protein
MDALIQMTIHRKKRIHREIEREIEKEREIF